MFVAWKRELSLKICILSRPNKKHFIFKTFCVFWSFKNAGSQLCFRFFVCFEKSGRMLKSFKYSINILIWEQKKKKKKKKKRRNILPDSLWKKK